MKNFLVVLLALVAGVFAGRESLRVWPTTVDVKANTQADPFNGLQMRILPLGPTPSIPAPPRTNPNHDEFNLDELFGP